MRTCLLLLAFLSSSLAALIAQNAEPASPSSGNSQAGQTQSVTPLAPTGEPSGRCPVTPKPEQSALLHGRVSSGRLIRKANPHYPKALRKAHVEGTVLLCATIGKDGKLHNLLAISGPQELISYAWEAVEHWRYEPYRVNKKPVDVDSEIRVDFRLSR